MAFRFGVTTDATHGRASERLRFVATHTSGFRMRTRQRKFCLFVIEIREQFLVQNRDFPGFCRVTLAAVGAEFVRVDFRFGMTNNAAFVLQLILLLLMAFATGDALVLAR